MIDVAKNFNIKKIAKNVNFFLVFSRPHLDIYTDETTTEQIFK